MRGKAMTNATGLSDRLLVAKQANVGEKRITEIAKNDVMH